MPSESLDHKELLDAGDIYIQLNFKNISSIRKDVYSPLGCSNKVHGLRPIPDIFVDFFDGRKIIGEAKTGKDVLTQRSQSQYQEYIEYLENYAKGSMLIIFCPWQQSAALKNWCRRHLQHSVNSEIQWKVVTNVDMKGLE